MSDIKIIFEDENILVLDKPFGITVNNSDTTENQETVQDFLENRNKSQISNPNDQIDPESDFYKRAGIVHRIDKETSGILLVAKNSQAFINLQAQFKSRVVHKTYLALVHGRVVPETGNIAVPVGRLPWDRKKFGVLAGGKEAETDYRVIESFESRVGKRQKEILSLLELNPKTGRTHQIRVHLKYLNHPIFADYLYAGRKTSRDDRNVLNRVFLHAHKISFLDPKTQREVNFTSSLPHELEQALQILKQQD